MAVWASLSCLDDMTGDLVCPELPSRNDFAMASACAGLMSSAKDMTENSTLRMMKVNLFIMLLFYSFRPRKYTNNSQKP